MTNDPELRTHLTHLLTARQAHMLLEDAVANFPPDHINTRPPNCEYTFWHLLEHLRICQKDILEYIQATDYHWPTFPDDLWPDRAAQATPTTWQHTLDQFYADRAQLVQIINDPQVDLFAPLPNSGPYQHHILREINIIASHNAYHTGEFAIMRGLLGLWGQNL